jgi:hypothetical protein
MQEDPSEDPAWTTAEDLSGKDLFLILKRITHTLVSSRRVAELHQELDSASRTSREDSRPCGQLTVGLHHDPPHISDKSLEAAANIAENNEFICYGDEEDGDTAMPSLSKSEINNDDDDDDNDIRNASSNIIYEAADLSPFRYKSLLQSFEDVFAEEKLLLLYDVTNLSNGSSTAASCTRGSTLASSLSLSHSTLNQGQRFENRAHLTIFTEQSVGVNAKGQDPF